MLYSAWYAQWKHQANTLKQTNTLKHILKLLRQSILTLKTWIYTQRAIYILLWFFTSFTFYYDSFLTTHILPTLYVHFINDLFNNIIVLKVPKMSYLELWYYCIAEFISTFQKTSFVPVIDWIFENIYIHICQVTSDIKLQSACASRYVV